MSAREPKTVTDPRALAALAHPLRQRLIDLLTLEGPATASALAARTGQAVGNISHHLRMLASGGFIEPAPELARDRRERWWRLTSPDIRLSRSQMPSDATTTAVADAVGSLYLERQLAIVKSWLASRESYGSQWREGCSVMADAWLRLTPSEARELADQLVAVINAWANRQPPADDQSRESVFVCANLVPARP